MPLSLPPISLADKPQLFSQTGTGSLKYLKAFQAPGTQHGQESLPACSPLGQMESQTPRSDILLAPGSASPISTGHGQGPLLSRLASLFQSYRNRSTRETWSTEAEVFL